MRLLSIALLSCLLAGCSLGGHNEAREQPGSVWKTVQSPVCGFSVAMPRPASHAIQSNESGTVQDGYIAELQGGQSFSVSCTIPSTHLGPHIGARAVALGLAFENQMRDSGLYYGLLLVPDALGKCPGWHLRGSVRQNDRHHLWRGYVAEDRVFLLMAGTGTTPESNDLARRFLESFQAEACSS